MPNILGEGFKDYVVNQITTRERIYGTVTRNEEVLAYQNSQTAFACLVSGVDIQDPNFLNKSSLAGLGLANNALAEKFVLINGVVDFSQTVTPGADTGVGLDDPKQGLATDGSILNQGAYGFGGLEFGLRPIPGITSVNVTSGPRGSLRFGEVKIKAWNRAQFEAIDTLYMRLGYTVLLEYGHTNYFDNNGKFYGSNPWSMRGSFLSGKCQYPQVPGVEQGKKLGQFDVLRMIAELRDRANGNYDALYGKVANFNWSYNKDGSFDITVKIVSMGDIIESLRVNTLATPVGALQEITPENKEDAETTEPPPQTSAEIIDSAASKHDIGKMLSDVKRYLDTSGTDAGGGTTTKAFGVSKDKDGRSLVDAIKQNWQEGTKDSTYYIRLGSFLQWYSLSKMFKGTDNKPMLDIDFDTDSNIVFFPYGQRSTDPSICLVSINYNTKGGYLQEYAKGAEPYVKVSSGPAYIMNVYLNFEFILTTLESLIDNEGKVVLIDFLERLLSGICDALGNVNKLSVAVDEESNIIKIIDEVKIPGRDDFLKANFPDISTKLAKFTLYGFRDDGTSGRGTFVSDFKIDTGFSKETAAMIAIGAQANGQVVGEDATAFSAWSKGLIDRIEPSKVGTVKPETGSYDDTFKEDLSRYYTFLDSLASKEGSLPVWTAADISAYNSFQKTYLNWRIGENARSKGVASNTIGFLPINLSLTMEGLGGMKVYQKFAVDSTFLPANYPTALEFITKAVNHSIQGGKWITTIESLVVPNSIPNTGEMEFGSTSGVDRASARGQVNTSQPIAGKGKPNLVPESKRGIVTKIIDYAKSKGVTDKNRMTCLIAVAWSETTLDYTQAEGKLNYSFKTARKVFPGKLKKVDDEQLKTLTAQRPQKDLYDLLYKPGGWKYRGRGLTQCTFTGGYKALTESLRKNGEKIDLINNPDLLITDELISVKALVIGKIEGNFGKKLSPTRDYLNNFLNVFQTQTGGGNGCMTVYSHYKDGWEGVKQTQWIQKLFNDKGLT